MAEGEENNLVEILSKPENNPNKSEKELNDEKVKLKTVQLQLIDNITTFEQLDAYKECCPTETNFVSD